MSVSSQDLHPRTGARLVFVREDDEGVSYGVDVFLPEGLRVMARVRWDAAGESIVEGAEAATGDHAWVVEEIHKLARVLRRTPKQRLVRWRGRA